MSSCNRIHTRPPRPKLGIDVLNIFHRRIELAVDDVSLMIIPVKAHTTDCGKVDEAEEPNPDSFCRYSFKPFSLAH